MVPQCLKYLRGEKDPIPKQLFIVSSLKSEHYELTLLPLYNDNKPKLVKISSVLTLNLYYLYDKSLNRYATHHAKQR